jgi:hypothetical protein
MPTRTAIDARLAAYATFASVALGVAPAAEAAIVFNPINLNIPSTVSGIYLNLVTGVAATTPGGAPGWDLNLWGTTSLSIWANNAASPNDGVITNFPGGVSGTSVDNCPCGTLVNDTWTYSRTSAVETTGPTAFQLNSNNNYIGFRFLNEATGQYDFGWAQISLSSGFATQPRVLLQYAYENSGMPLTVGLLTCVPEPSSVAFLTLVAAGAAGVRVWRSARRND